MAHEREITEARDFLSRILVWPKQRQVHVHAWISNFEDAEEREVAHALLDAFVHINNDHREAALVSTVKSLSTRAEFGMGEVRREQWEKFADTAIASIPLSHAGDGAASGYQFLRIARKIGFAKYVDSEYLVRELLSAGEPLPILFMDDITGTGNQFIRNWQRVYTSPSGRSSLKNLKADGRIGSVYFAPIVATEEALERIESETGVVVHPTYVLSEDYSASSSNTRLVPSRLRESLLELAVKYAPATRADQDGPLGYQDQGLAISFSEGSPNNTLPILGSVTESESWKALLTYD